MSIAVSARVYARNSLGRFIAECDAAGTKTAQSLAEKGETAAKNFAPVGHKPDPRTIPLRESIGHAMIGAKTGVIYATARHALVTEFGGAPHVISGSPALKFYWENAGRWWVPGSEFYGIPGLVDVVNHPGSPAQPYLRPAYRLIMGMAIETADRYYPG